MLFGVISILIEIQDNLKLAHDAMSISAIYTPDGGKSMLSGVEQLLYI